MTGLLLIICIKPNDPEDRDSSAIPPIIGMTLSAEKKAFGGGGRGRW